MRRTRPPDRPDRTFNAPPFLNTFHQNVTTRRIRALLSANSSASNPASLQGSAQPPERYSMLEPSFEPHYPAATKPSAGPRHRSTPYPYLTPEHLQFIEWERFQTWRKALIE